MVQKTCIYQMFFILICATNMKTYVQYTFSDSYFVVWILRDDCEDLWPPYEQIYKNNILQILKWYVIWSRNILMILCQFILYNRVFWKLLNLLAWNIPTNWSWHILQADHACMADLHFKCSSDIASWMYHATDLYEPRQCSSMLIDSSVPTM